MNTPPMMFGHQGTPFSPDDPGEAEPETFYWFFGNVEIDVCERDYPTVEAQLLNRRLGTTEWGWTISVFDRIAGPGVSIELVDQADDWSLNPATAATKAEKMARTIKHAFSTGSIR